MPQTKTQTDTPPLTIAVRSETWRDLRTAAELTSDADLADVLGVARQTVYRTMAGQTTPSPEFIASALYHFKHIEFRALFAVVPAHTR